MADIGIDPFGDSYPDDSGKIFLSAQEEEDPLGNQNANKKQYSEQGELKTESSLILTWKVCTRSYLSIMAKPTHYDNFRCKGKWFYFKGRDEPLINDDEKLRTFCRIESILGKNRLCDLDFDMLKGPTAWQAVILNTAKEELPPTSDVANADDIELHEIMENTSRSTKNLIKQLEGEYSDDLPM